MVLTPNNLRQTVAYKCTHIVLQYPTFYNRIRLKGHCQTETVKDRGRSIVLSSN